MKLVSLSLHNIKNIRNGDIGFETLDSGGSLTGIYGANGSGKTSVIKALRLLQDTLNPMKDISAHMRNLITQGEDNADLSATFQERGRHLEYQVYYKFADDGQLTVSRECVYVGRHPSRMGRVFVQHDADPTQPLALYPARRWRGVVNAAPDKTETIIAERDAYRMHNSFLFSDMFLDTLADTAQGAYGRLSDESARSLERYDIEEAFTLMRKVRDYVLHRMFLLETDHTAWVSYELLPMAVGTKEGRYVEHMLSLRQENRVSEQAKRQLEDSIRMFNHVLPYLVHGLTIDLNDLGPVELDDGDPGRAVSIVSVRGKRRIPLRDESEGIIRIVGMLAFLIRAYNDPDVFVAIDEIDTGVFEYLLGEILYNFSANMQGQLVFTAHNLRPMERMVPLSKTIVLSTLDEDNKFIRYGKVLKTNNPRHKYLRMVEFGGAEEPIYEYTAPQLIGAGFTLAGSAQRHPSHLKLNIPDSLKVADWGKLL